MAFRWPARGSRPSLAAGRSPRRAGRALRANVAFASGPRRFSPRFWIVALLAAALLWTFVVAGERGVLTWLRLTGEVSGLKDENRRLSAENVRLRTEIRDAQRDPSRIERAAREDLSMSRPGEILYHLPMRPTPR